MNKKKRATLAIAAGFFLFWLAVLYAGADHPPPPGFILLVVLDLGCSLAVYFRIGTYIDLAASKKKYRLLLPLLDGLAAGLVVALFMVLLPRRADPGMPVPGILERVIWYAILASVGALNSLAVYALSALMSRGIASRGGKELHHGS